MKKINGLVLSTLTAALLIGCGGGSGGGTAETTAEAGVTNITYDRGPVYEAIVTDAKNKPAINVGKNIYQFVGEVSYPITAKGGKVDTDGDGLVDETLPSDFEYQSYYEVITPITNYLSSFDTEEKRTEQLTKLVNITGLTPEEMKTKVSTDFTDETKLKSFNGLKNTLFKAAIDSDRENDNIFLDDGSVNIVFKNAFDLIKEKTEKEVFNDLRADTSAKFSFTEISKEDAEKIKKDLGTASDKLKIADLGRFVSYEGADDWFDDNTLSGDKLTFKPYSYDYNSSTSKSEWTLDEEDGYVTITKDATNPYKFSYVDSLTKEEGTFTIISTTKLGNYTDLSKSIAKIEVTKEASENFDSWVNEEWSNPYYYDNSTMKSITDIDSLVASYTFDKDKSHSFYFNNDTYLSLNSDNTISTVKWVSTSSSPHETIVKVPVKGSWAIESDKLVVKFDNQTRYEKVIKKEDGKYYIETTEISNVGYIDNEVIYTGSSLDDLIANIKAPAPVFTSFYMSTAVENQTTTTYKAVATPGNSNLKITYSLGTDSDSNKFNIDSSTGVLTFKTAPDYETKSYYNLNVIATDSFGKTNYQFVYVTVTNVDEQTTTPTEPTPTDYTTFSKSDLVGKKLVVANETFFFEQDRVVLGDSGSDYTTTLSYSTVESNKIVLSNGDILEKTADGYKITFEFGTAQQEISTGLQLSIFEINELENALSDVDTSVPQSNLDSEVYGKKVIAHDDEGSVTFTFNKNGTYSELFGNGDSCSGKWLALEGLRKIGVTCEPGEGTTATPDNAASSTTNILVFMPAEIYITEPGKPQYVILEDSRTDIQE